MKAENREIKQPGEPRPNSGRMDHLAPPGVQPTLSDQKIRNTKFWRDSGEQKGRRLLEKCRTIDMRKS